MKFVRVNNLASLESSVVEFLEEDTFLYTPLLYSLVLYMYVQKMMANSG